ncbi:hypothetical protein C1I98_06010 [Spongiactinospora gelatinilytica]|uniref:Uncharacterized protein n=1 Tax=Spongiactinospora gelatinilytica TaxID=2666298 RepID=A0A2W2HRB0_9ACTN|nr:SAM-dependent methyltransferase [Spongiactinospora gelatinilytica]PZG53110.1 hypothetical protein C1I98_06010 [Spongiactinospora gelatinilytica]
MTLDMSQPNVARIYDYLLGGKDNLPADRAIGDASIAQDPDIPAEDVGNAIFLGGIADLNAYGPLERG